MGNLALWGSLDQFKVGGVPPGYPANIRTFFAPQDDIRGALKALLSSATQSLAISMYGYDDGSLNELIRQKTADSTISVQISLDLSQSLGCHEKAILATWNAADASNSIAIGKSAHGAINHLKMCVVDNLYVIGGSTNWSISGETLQNNELTIIRDAVVAKEAESLLDTIHLQMLSQMVK